MCLSLLSLGRHLGRHFIEKKFKNNVIKLINLGNESEKIEFKASTSEKHEAVESIVAILNKSKSGIVYFGVLDNGEVKGQIVTDSAIRDIADIIMQNIEPRITPTIEHIIIDNKSVLKVMLNGTSKQYSAFGKFLIRIGTQNRKMDREELLNILGKITYTLSWEKEESEFTTDNINSDTLNNFYNESLSRQ